MSLSPGTRLGPYEIVTLLGAGGMGEVYRARDTRLDRVVAVKVLPAHLAVDPQFRERFDREARVISQLDHPHICALYDVGTSAAVPPDVAGGRSALSPGEPALQFLVMQYLEGDTLAERLAKGALPLTDALGIAIQIADALDKAHRAGITHRDLKPGNIFLIRGGGTAAPVSKLLDFGLAKIAPTAGLSRVGQGLSPAVAGSGLPTQEALTAHGTILGTFQYMAPEQIEGEETDARTDLFALGVVLYEMLTGKKAFSGKTQASLFGAILKDDPPALSTLQPLTPPVLDHIVERCLAKDPGERWQTAADLRRELTWAAEGGSKVGVATPATAEFNAASRRKERFMWATTVAALVLVVAGLALMAGRALRSASSSREMRLEITTPPTTDPASLAISPDAQKLVFVANSDNGPRLWERSLESTSARSLAGTEGATYPFWSPDSRSVGFFAGSKLKRIDLEGGSVQDLANAAPGRGGAWNRDGTILFTPQTRGPIFRVPATGGEPAAVTRLTPGQTNHRFPQVLPDGRHFLYYTQSSSPETRGVYVGQVDGADTQRLLDADAAAVFASSGHLLFIRQGTLFAQPFDPARLALGGTPVAIAEQVAIDAASTNLGALSASAAGPIIYRSGSGSGRRQFIWFDRSGKELANVGEPDPASPMIPSLSPDGRRVAMQRTVNANIDVWLLDAARGVLTRFTSDTTIDNYPVWSPDGDRIVFGSIRKEFNDFYSKSATGTGTEDLLLSTMQTKNAMDWSRDGRFLLYRSLDPKSGYDLWALPMDGEGRKPFPVVQTAFEERDGQFSPDSKWIAYQSNESSRFEIYVQAFPGSGGKSRVSTNGGAQVRWGRDGKELFYIALDGRLMAVPIGLSSDSQSLEPGTPVPLFATHVGGAVQSNFAQQYAVSGDGRFLMNTVTEEAAAPITVILNWKPKS